MIWNYIQAIQPEHGATIIQLDPPIDYSDTYEDFYFHCAMGMRKYVQECSWEEIIKWCEDNECPTPCFWWIYAKDFKFPKQFIKK